MPRFISPADPVARWSGADGGLAFFAYLANYLIDLDHAIIVDVEATIAIRQAEVTAAKRMIGRTMDRLRSVPGSARRRQRLRIRGDAELAHP